MDHAHPRLGYDPKPIYDYVWKPSKTLTNPKIYLHTFRDSVGKEGGIELLKENLNYLAFVNETILKSKDKEEFKAAILKKYPEYGGEQLVDIYLDYYLKPNSWAK